jgi:hypothetical protein
MPVVWIYFSQEKPKAKCMKYNQTTSSLLRYVDNDGFVLGAF